MSGEASISCRELIDFIADYLDGALSANQVQLFEEHLAICPDCVSYLESYRQSIRLGREAFADEATLEMAPEELVQAVLSARRG